MRRHVNILISIAILVILFHLSTLPDVSVYGQKWNINYDSPERYLVPGEQSQITDEETITSLKSTFQDCRGLTGLRDLYLWMTNEFTWYNAGGKLIGKTSIDQLLNEKELSGCSDCALVYSAVARYLGYPTIMVDTAGIEWAQKYKAGSTTSYSGHVFVEVYIRPTWILVDPSTGEFIRNYDPSNPVIPITKSNEKIGYYALLKGKDMWDYGVTNPESLHTQLRAFTKTVDTSAIEMPTYKIESLTTIITEKTPSQTLTTITSIKTTSTPSLPWTPTQTVAFIDTQTEIETGESAFSSYLSLLYLITIITAIIGGVALTIRRLRRHPDILKIFCIECGKQIHKESKLCPKCGARQGEK